MSRIKQINLENFAEILNVIEDYQQFLQERGNSIPSFKDQLKELLSQQARIVFALYQEDQAIGFTIINPSEREIRLFYIQNSIKEENTPEYHFQERELFDTAFTYLQNIATHIRLGAQLSTNLKTYAIKRGFQEFKRARMFIEKESIELLPEPNIEPEFKFYTWNSKYINIVAELMGTHHYNDMHPDSALFPQSKGFNGAKTTIEHIQTVKDGKFKNENIGVLTHNNEIIGTCFVVIFPEYGIIPEVILSPKYRGKGLGKALVAHTLKRLIEKEPHLSKVELNVTLLNIPAFNLYKSLGFQESYQYSVFIWNKT
ncbi:MAG: GNAT family N-acetyltransferase [Candidatus Hermodarchaeota archaeon]